MGSGKGNSKRMQATSVSQEGRTVTELDGGRTVEYRFNGELHRTDGPAIKRTDGKDEWYYYGELHRVNGPAIENKAGNGIGDQWFYRGKRHRMDGPALVTKDGIKEWYRNGGLHRVGGPAIEIENEYKAWYKDGILHRVNGPAVEYGNGRTCWYENSDRHRADGPAVYGGSANIEWCVRNEEIGDDIMISWNEYLVENDFQDQTISEHYLGKKRKGQLSDDEVVFVLKELIIDSKDLPINGFLKQKIKSIKVANRDKNNVTLSVEINSSKREVVIPTKTLRAEHNLEVLVIPIHEIRKIRV